jgi:hypothetical protein
MAFTMKQPKEIKSNNEKDSIEFLQPKKDAVKDSMNDPYRAEVTQKSAYQYTLKTLNALKIVSPIIMALMQRPGIDSTSEDLSQSFKQLISETSSISEYVCEQLGIDPQKERNFWVRNVLEKSFAEILNAQWTTSGKINVEPLKLLVEQIIKFGETTAEKVQYDELPEESLIKIATIKAMLPIFNEAQVNSLYRNLDNDIEPIMTKLFEISKLAVIKLSDDYANEKDRSKLFYMIIQEAGQLYASAWKAEGIRVAKIMANHPPEKLQNTLDKYKKTGGLPITKIDNDFDKYFDKMLVITEKLVLSQKGNISNRLKNK